MFANCSFKMLLASTALTIGMATPATAADFYLKIDGIPGESRIEPGALDLEGVTYGVDAPTKPPKVKSNDRQSTGTGMGRGKVSLQDFSFVVRSGKASPLIFKACAQGQHIKQATLTCRKSGGDGAASTTYLKITMKDAMISSFAPTASNSDDAPFDAFSMIPLQVTFDYLNSDGEIVASDTYDLATNKK